MGMRDIFHAHTWDELLKKLRNREIPTEEIGSAIVKLGKPFNQDRILTAKDAVASYLDHPNAWVRHEALWFLTSWGKLPEHKLTASEALRHDPDVDNRSFAALCLAHLLRGSHDPAVIKVLKEVVEDESEDKLVRLSAYGALLEVVKSESGFDFQAAEKDLSDIDWKWVRSLQS